MLHRTRNHLQNRKSYWDTKAFLEKQVRFRLLRRKYLIKHSYNEERISWYILRSHLKQVFVTGVYAAFFVAIVEYFSYRANDISFHLSNEQLVVLISTVITVSGVFFGLYFTALGSIAGSHFARAPKNLQDVFKSDRLNNQYLRTLELTTIVGVYYLVLLAFGYKVSFLGPAIIAILALFVIIRFKAIGYRAFSFVRPGEGSATISQDARRMVDNAAAGKLGWDKPYSQSSFRVEASLRLESMKSLVEFGVKVIELSEQQLVEVAQNTGALLDYYLENKRRIPTDSKWFTDKQQHQNWLLADSGELVIALNTGTSLTPKTTKDSLWFENECIDIILQIFEILVKNKKWEYAPACIEIIVYATEQLSANLYIDEAKAVLARVQKATSPIVDKQSNSLSESEKKGQLAVIDGIGRLSTGLLVGLIKHLDKRSNEVLDNIKNIKWHKDTSIYNSGMPGQVLTTLEEIRKGVTIEIGMEGHRISPEWYTSTRVVQAYLRDVKKYYDYLKSMSKDVFDSKTKDMMDKDNPLPAAHLTERWLEFNSKMFTCSSLLKRFLDKADGLKKVHDLPWTEIDMEAEKTSLQESDKLANDRLVELLPVLSALPQSDLFELPDYFGQAYTFGVMAAYQAVNDNDTERLKKMFPAIFIGALKAHELLLKETKGWSEKSRIIFSTEPLEDILVLSGFIKIYAELYENNELWEACRVVWDRYLTGTDAKAKIETFVAFTSYRDSVYTIMPKAGLRHNWDLALARKLEELGLSQEPFGDPLNPRPASVDHPSPLIRTMARHAELMTFDARNVFYVTYLSKHGAAEGIEFPDRRELERMLNAEEERGNEEES